MKWMRLLLAAVLGLLSIGALALSVVDGWRPAGGNGVSWIEFLIRDEPQQHVDDYLRAVASGDRDEALSVWQIPNRGASGTLAALGQRRDSVTDRLVAAARRGHRILDVQWWSTCCEPHPVRDQRYASFARITVEFTADTERYVFDVRTADPSRSLIDELARRWILSDVYRSDEQPLLFRWVANGTGSDRLGAAAAGPAGASQAPKDCGQSEERPPSSYDPNARDCVWTAYSSGVPVRWTVKTCTEEGDAILGTLAVQQGVIDVTRDLTADRFAAASDRRRWTWTCPSMSKRAWATDANRFSFELTNCSGDAPSTTFP